MRIVDMSASNSWAEFAAVFRTTRLAFLDHEKAKAELKMLMPEDAKEAIGHGVRAKRSKSGAVSFDLLDAEVQPCIDLVKRSGRLRRRSPRRRAELTNPEKSLTATMRPDGPGAAERSFRYAPLSSGLDIVRKPWASMRLPPCKPRPSTRTAGLLRLTTVLAHSSGDWVVIRLAGLPGQRDRGAPPDGAALTYARRYALFTLVGIAGEDDLDAPDLKPSTPRRTSE